LSHSLDKGFTAAKRGEHLGSTWQIRPQKKYHTGLDKELICKAGNGPLWLQRFVFQYQTK